MASLLPAMLGAVARPVRSWLDGKVGRLMSAYQEYEAREMVVQKRLNRGPVAPFPLNAIIAIVQLLWLLLKWLVHVIWAGFKWLRRFLGGERQVL